MRKLLIAALAMLAGIAAATAQSYPARPVTAIVPASAGGPTDTIGRIVMARAQQLLGQTIVIENVGGASGTIGTGRLVRAEPDGYTIGIGGLNHYVVNASVYPLTYDTLKDFEPISLLANGPMLIMSRNSLPAKNLQELIAWLKAKRTTSRSAPAGSRARRISAACRCRPSPATNSSSCRSAAPRRRCSRCRRPARHHHRSGLRGALHREGRRRARLCGDGEAAARLRARYPDGRRSRPAGLPRLDLAGRVGAEGHAEGHHRQAQCRDRRRARRSGRAEAARRDRPGECRAPSR